uniref:Uncharacterized protein n=1 Tax=Geladintestivirus 5 TaxID=3233137 RepID=A0AAU8MJP5_9CAUD
MYYSNDPEEVVTGCLTSIFVTLIVLVGIIFGTITIYKHYTEDKNIITNSTTEYIDSIKKENDKLVLEVNNLDSLKNAKIIEVKSLDNDSTIKLFYKLICE